MDCFNAWNSTSMYIFTHSFCFLTRDPRYAIEMSERRGKSNSKEQYAYLYKQYTGISVTKKYQYPDYEDVFQREPYAVEFTVNELGKFILQYFIL